MLSTDDKQVSTNIRRYIFEHSLITGVELEFPDDFDELSYLILRRATKEGTGKDYGPEISLHEFESWCKSLPSIFDTTYYLYGADKELSDILERSEEERLKKIDYGADILTALIYKELTRGLYEFDYKLRNER